MIFKAKDRILICSAAFFVAITQSAYAQDTAQWVNPQASLITNEGTGFRLQVLQESPGSLMIPVGLVVDLRGSLKPLTALSTISVGSQIGELSQNTLVRVEASVFGTVQTGPTGSTRITLQGGADIWSEGTSRIRENPRAFAYTVESFVRGDSVYTAVVSISARRGKPSDYVSVVVDSIRLRFEAHADIWECPNCLSFPAVAMMQMSARDELAFFAAPLVIGKGAFKVDGQNFDNVVAVMGPGVKCSGSLVGKLIVLTAAHCWRATRVLIGPNIENNPVRVPVARIDPPITKTPDIDHPIALILQWIPDVEVRPIKTTLVQNASLAQIVGYGASMYGSYGRRMAGRVNIKSSACRGQTNGQADSSYYNCRDGEIVATGQDVNTCGGDSGGSLLVENSSGAFLVGITSRSFKGDADCHGTIFMRPDQDPIWFSKVVQPKP